ncbi:ImmA/IrrE family metallo-endopeptidase [Microbacterium oxydans]|uniref:ImmA/IrrE family metallo-endopeptidase n=1 Tax=Microbacterium oxydans TaxID=82380 RepID=UPI0024AE6EC2|nr:ImmA/IrrE family metallo-endopeptidase [Microbacterium oxydans]
MKELIAHAASLGVSVHAAHIDGPQRGFYDADLNRIVLDYELTPVERDTVLAHELGHVFYGHDCYGNPSFEAAANYYAACLLIDPERYIAAVAIDPAPDAIAEELGVEPKLVRAFEAKALTRVRGVTYVHSRMGARQYGYAAAH